MCVFRNHQKYAQKQQNTKIHASKYSSASASDYFTGLCVRIYPTATEM